MSRPRIIEDAASNHASRPTGLYVLLIAASVMMAFRAAFEAGFLDWDDRVNFLDHANWRGLGAEQVGWMFTESHNGPYQPLAWLTLGLDYELWGLESARPYHIVNVVWHALTSISLFFLARAVIAHVRPASTRIVEAGAMVAALFFALHPLRVESVVWITERRDVVSGPFYVLCLLFWFRYATRSDARWGLDASLSLAAFLLALLGKGIGFTLPIALLVLDVWPLRRQQLGAARLLGEKLPFIALGVVFAWVAFEGQAALHQTMASLETFGLGRRVMQSFYGAAFYLRATFAPFGLSPFHPQPDVAVSLLDARFVLSALALTAGAVVAWLLRARALLAAFAFYLVIVAPVLGLVQTGPQLVAERYSYLSCMPFAVLVGGLVVWGLERAAYWRSPMLLLAAILLGALNIMTWRLVPAWRDDLSLWARVAETYPDHLVVLRKRAVLESKRIESLADPAQRVRDLRALIESIHAGAQSYTERLPAAQRPSGGLWPDASLMTSEAEAWRALAELEPERAEENLERARHLLLGALDLRRSANEPINEALSNFAILLCAMGRWAEAAEQFEELVRVAPDDPSGLLCLGQAQVQAKQHSAALVSLRRALELAPRTREAWVEMGIAFEHLQQHSEARGAHETALRIHAEDRLPNDTVWLDARTGLERLAQPVPPPPPR